MSDIRGRQRPPRHGDDRRGPRESHTDGRNRHLSLTHAADPTGHRYEHIERDGDLVAVVCTRCGAHWEVEQG